MRTWFDLTGRCAVVTGGSKGLGRTIAGALAQAGADVAIVSRTPADLQRAADELRAHGPRVLPVPADVTDEASIRAMVQQVIDQFGQIDILVNNAGVGATRAVVEMEAADWDEVLQVNLRGPVLCCKHVGPHMIGRRTGKIINVASVLATRVARYMSAYCASKAAMVQFTRTLALEWIRHNIQVNALCPGYFLTDMNAEFFGSARGKQFVEALPIGRLGKPHELEGAAVFLASDATSYVTGAALYVDGGHTLA
ncbi:MAG TPA: glucose 1-dehydrogenase [Candidatus Margulisiibacteriota bacterium]|nr:glucose 1-dehydrogenase [Candidatus Margulisiibacteriota bacterium]